MRLGHFALSQTVSNRNSSKRRAVKWFAFPFGISRFNQRGSRGESAGDGAAIGSGKVDGEFTVETMEKDQKDSQDVNDKVR
jgi:hypothetical protein